jgi:hypothetical protein
MSFVSKAMTREQRMLFNVSKLYLCVIGIVAIFAGFVYFCHSHKDCDDTICNLWKENQKLEKQIKSMELRP